MSPRNGKLPKNEKASTAQKEKILSSREKVLKTKRAVLAIVEAMLEQQVSKEWFLEKCTKLCHADYSDVVQERNIEHLCGYPMCSNTIKQILKQKYHISQVTNKVYDITERKCFCSNHCYKASNYLKAQLSPVPLYMRKEETIKVHLLSDSNNRGSAGDEIIFHHTIPQNEIDKVCTEEPSSDHYTNILNEEIKKCVDSLADLKIKEHVFEKKYVFGDQPEKKKTQDPVGDDKSESDSKLDSDDSDDETLFPHYDNIEVLSEKQMPIPKHVKKSLLISPLPPKINAGSPAQEISLTFISGVFKDWVTEDTIKYLWGEKYVYGIKADHLFEKMTSDSIDSEKLLCIKNEYINLCIKIDNLPDTDISDSSDLDIIIPKETNKSASKKKNVDKSSTRKVFKRRPKRRSKEKNTDVTSASETSTEKKNICVDNKPVIEGEPVSELTNSKGEKPRTKNKSVTFAPDVKDSVKNSSCMNVESQPAVTNEAASKESAPESSLPPPMFPLVDSLSQNALRRQVLTNNLKSVYADLLPIVGLHYTDVRHGVKKFVDTLSLTPTNIMFKPKEWKLIALILFRILTRTILKDIHDEVKFLKLCEDRIMPVRMSITEIENLVHDIISPERYSST